LDAGGAVLAGVGGAGVEDGLAVGACVAAEALAGVAVEAGGRAEAAVHARDGGADVEDDLAEEAGRSWGIYEGEVSDEGCGSY